MMTTEPQMEAMELSSSHGEDENDMSLDPEPEESPNTSPSDRHVTATVNQPSSSMDTTGVVDSPYKGVCLAGEVKEGEKKAPTFWRKSRNTAVDQTTTINKFYIGDINSPTLINVAGETTSSTRKSNDFYHTPDNDMHKKDGNVSSTKNRLSFGAKSARTSRRALDFGDRVPAVPKAGAKQSDQSKIPYPCRKRRVNRSASKSPGKRHHGGDNERHSCRIENHFNIGKVEGQGCLIIGNNNNINIPYVRGEVEDVEPDSSYPSVSPEKSLKVTADENFETFMAEFQDIINNLHPLRDKGNYEEFNCVAKEIAGSSCEPHIQILVLIEKSVALSYQKKFAASRNVVDEIIKMISNPGVKMKNCLLTYLYVHQAGLSRRQNYLTEASQFVSTAKQNDEFIPFGMLRVFVVYEHASNLSKLLSLMNVDEEEPFQIMKDDATKSLRECISLSRRIHEENSSLYLQRSQFSLVKLALLNLNCRTKTSRTHSVGQESIDEAELCLRHMEECEGDMSEALSTQYYVAKSDLFFRKKDFLRSKAYAEQALGIAKENNVTLEIKPIEDKLEDINKLLNTTD